MENFFKEQILKDLNSKDLSEQDLLIAYKQRQAQIKPAIQALLTEAHNVALGKAEYDSYNNIFKDI